MFSIRQKREIAQAVQEILRNTQHPELPKDEIQFTLEVKGAESWSWAIIKNNSVVTDTSNANPFNKLQDKQE